MLGRIKRFFDQHLGAQPAATEVDERHKVRLATAALLLEMAYMDGEFRPEQRETIEAAVVHHFELSDEESTQLLELAEAERSGSTDFFQFTSLINARYTPEQKIVLMETLWRIAYANDALHRHEEFLARKLADLLHVPHSNFIAAKNRVIGHG